jgi:leucyl-tRNA synthetase
MMICVNEMEKAETVTVDDFKKFLQILAPFTPHVAEELWYVLGEKKTIHQAGWPEYNAKLIVDDTTTIAIQINGKTRGTIEVAQNSEQADIENMAKQHPDIVRHMADREVIKTIYVPNRLINFVVKA